MDFHTCQVMPLQSYGFREQIILTFYFPVSRSLQLQKFHGSTPNALKVDKDYLLRIKSMRVLEIQV